MEYMQKTKKRAKRAAEDETVEQPAKPVSDTTAAAELVAAIDEILGV